MPLSDHSPPTRLPLVRKDAGIRVRQFIFHGMNCVSLMRSFHLDAQGMLFDPVNELSLVMARLSTDLIRYRIGVAAQEGANPTDILNTAQVSPQLMNGEPPYVDAEVERQVWQAIVEHTGREDIGLICGSRFPTQLISMLGYVMANAPTMRIAVEKCCAYQRIVGDTMGMAIEKGTDTSRIWLEQWSEWHDSLRYTVDMMMAAIPSWASANAPLPIRPLRVGFHYERPADTAPYESIFTPAPVAFGTPDSFQIYANDVLDQPVIGANRDMFVHFEDKAQRLLSDYEGRDTYLFKTRQRVLQSLQGATPAIEAVASELAVSARKLQAALAAEGTSFSTILNDARRDLAMQYLDEKEISNAEIAYLLGYSEVSVFSRSFKKWTGKTPSKYAGRKHV